MTDIEFGYTADLPGSLTVDICDTSTDRVTKTLEDDADRDAEPVGSTEA